MYRANHIVKADVGAAFYQTHVLKTSDILDFENELVVIEPIPLSDEWFWRMGFMSHHEDFYNTVLCIKPFRDKTPRWNVKFYPKALGSAVELNNPPVQYVHEIQDLMLSLTGQELDINLKSNY